MYGDPDQIDALARAVRAQAERAGALAYRVRDLGATIPWSGAAGDAFRARMRRRALACEVAHDDLLAAATALAEHADAVRTRLDQIRRLDQIDIGGLGRIPVPL